MHIDWFKIVFLWLNGNTKLAQPVDVMRAQTKRTYILITKANKKFSLFVMVFSKRNRKHCYCVSIELYVETFMKVWENLNKLWKHSPNGSCSHNISHSSKLSLVFL